MKHICEETFRTPMPVDVVMNDTFDRYLVRLSLGNLTMYFSEECADRISRESEEMLLDRHLICEIDCYSPGVVLGIFL